MCETTTATQFAHGASCIHTTALVLSYLAYRAMVDGDPNPKAQQMCLKIPGFARQEGIYDRFDPPEIRFLNAPYGSLGKAERSSASWMIESVGVLGWLIGKSDIPPFAQKVNGAVLSKILGLFCADTQERVSQAKMREAGEIEMYALNYKTIQWRLAKYFENPEKMNLTELLEDSSKPYLLVDNFALVDQDLTIDGKPLEQVPKERMGEVWTIVCYRFKAFLWLMGYEKNLSAIVDVN
jgi:hypothetical protein